MSRLPALGEAALRRLARSGQTRGRVLSVYVSLDSAQVPAPRSRRPEFGSLLGEAARRYLPTTRDHGEREALRSCLDRVRRPLENIEIADHPVRGVAVFCTAGGDLEAYRLRAPVHSAVAVGDSPMIEPLLEALPGPSWGVVLASRDHARILRGTKAFLAQVASIDDDVHRRHSQGGWSQARFQRGIGKEVEDHVRRLCELLFRLHRRRPFDHLIVGGPSEIWPVVDAKLHSYLKERLKGHVAIDVEHSSPEQALERVNDLMEREHRRRERESIQELEAGLGTGDQSVAGLAGVLAALNDRRVATMLVADGFGAPGVISPDSGRLSVADGTTANKTGLRPVENVVELAVEAALAQGAEVSVVHGGGLDSHDSIGALLRY